MEGGGVDGPEVEESERSLMNLSKEVELLECCSSKEMKELSLGS